MRFVILQDHKENLRKCTLAPLCGGDDVRFVRLPRPAKGGRPAAVEVEGGLLLHVEGPALCPADRALVANAPLVLVDSTWARVESVLARVRLSAGDRFVRRALPPDAVTAYPRSSKLYTDPRAGLASVEALFAASVILGEPRPEFLAEYRWKEEFLQRNRQVFARYA